MTTTQALKQLSISQLFNFSRLANRPSALWRRPGTSQKELLIDMTGTNRLVKTDLEELPAGFIVSPFLNPDNQKSRWLNADIYLCFNPQKSLINELSWGIEKIEYLEKEALASPKLKQNYFETRPNQEVINEQNQDKFIENVNQAIAAIKEGEFQKVVISKIKNIELSTDFEIVTAFDKLCEAYPNAFVSVVYLPEEDALWLGASPETLVSIDAEGIFRTVSLAGTQAAIDADGESISPAEARWSQKEIEEQSFVSRYIIECFKKIRLREYIENGPKTVQAGNLLHLRTDYSVDTKAVNFVQLPSVMLELLHPTSAVCGMPKATALAFILANEPHQRSYYSGYLGPVNIQNQSHLFVNLRTMQIIDNQGVVYAGAGITEDSKPLKEWRETEIKCQTLLNVIL